MMKFLLSDVSVLFHGTTVFQNLAGTIDGTSVSVIHGPTGAGKSTLMSLLHADLLPSSGTVSVNGINTASMKPTQRRLHKQQVAMVYQHPPVVPTLSVFHNVQAVFAMRGLTKEEANKKALELVAEAGISHCKQSLPSRISGGERQLLALACALALDPVTLLADEPTSMVDANTTVKISTMLNTRIGRGMGLVLTTHHEGLSRLLPVTNHFTLHENLITSSTTV